MLDLSNATVVPVRLLFGATAAARVTGLEPILVRVIVLLSGNPLDFRKPKEIVAGSATIVDAIAAPASRRPAPNHCTSTGSPNVSKATSCAAEFTSADLICAGV